MDSLTPHYESLLHYGLLVVRDAISSNNLDWARVEVEMLHNLPSLLHEPNISRHEYYWLQERDMYIQWIVEHGSEDAKSRMKSFYEPVWLEMEPIIQKLLNVNT